MAIEDGMDMGTDEHAHASENFDDTQILKLDLPAPPIVLIVDDDDLVLARLRELLSAAGYDVHTATNGPAALEVLRTSSASVVVTDLNMPGMDGFELCRRIRMQVWPGYVYVVLLTARDQEKDILAGLDAGADDYVSKRSSTAQFIARLRTAKRVLTLEYSLKDALAKKRILAMTDPLTSIYNRRYFMRHFGRELKRVQRFGGEISLLLLDIDHFKKVNDTYGHVVGDIVLKKLTRQLGKSLQRATDWCARLGGEEFAVVLEGTALTDARACAEKVRRAIANTAIETSAGTIRVTISIGVSGLESFPDRRSANIEAVLQHADTNLYASKAGGRNRVTLSAFKGTHSPAREPAIQRGDHVHSKVSLSSVR
jgi:two-component system cell cycle response regulator